MQLLDVAHHPEAAQRIRMLEGVLARGDRRRDLRLAAGGDLQQGLRRLRRQMIRQLQNAVLICDAHIVQPFGRDAIAEQIIIGEMIEQAGFGRSRTFCHHILGDDDLLHPLPHLHQLGRARFGMRLQLAAFGPAIRVVVMPHIAEQHAGRGLVHDDAQIAADPHRPEIRVLAAIQAMKAQARRGGIGL